MSNLAVIKNVSAEISALETFADVADFDKFKKNVNFYLLQNCKGYDKEKQTLQIKQGDKILNINLLSFFTAMVKAADAGCDLSKKEGYLIFRDNKSEQEGQAIFTPHWEFEKRQFEQANNCNVSFVKIYTNLGDKFYKNSETNFEIHIEKKENFTEKFTTVNKTAKSGYNYKAVTTTLPTHYACIIECNGVKYSRVESTENILAVCNTNNSTFYNSAASADYMYYKAAFRQLKKLLPSNLQNVPDYEKLTEYSDFIEIKEPVKNESIGELTEDSKNIVKEFVEPEQKQDVEQKEQKEQKQEKETKKVVKIELLENSPEWFNFLRAVASGKKMTFAQIENHYSFNEDLGSKIKEILK